MNRTSIVNLLAAVRAGEILPEEAARQLSPDEPLTLDFDRRERCGFPEVILAEGKRTEWVAEAVRQMAAAEQDVFVTRLNQEQADYLAEHFPQGEQDRLARTFWLPIAGKTRELRGEVRIVTAGTGDIPVAREAAATAEVMGVRTELIVDVGVAGIHRLLRHRDRLATADVVIVVAGMDGALPSVVGGLIDAPVIAVPTSVGYGAAFGGVAALLTMLNSCSAGVAVVNIDAGFKAGYVAARIIAKKYGSFH